MSGSSAAGTIEVVASTRRRWSAAERQAILAEAHQEGITVSAVARRHGLSPGLLFRWRREREQTKSRKGSGQGFVPLALPAPGTLLDEPASACGLDRIEIILAGGRRIIVGKDVEAAALRRIVDVLERG